MRIWRHVYKTEGTHILIYSPDTNVYNIGLSMSTCISSKEIIIQLNIPRSPTCSYIHLNNLVLALEYDPDLASLPRPKLNKIFQMLFICSGRDYISYFHGHGTAVFFINFFLACIIYNWSMCRWFIVGYYRRHMRKRILGILKAHRNIVFKKAYFSYVVNKKC